MVGEIARADWLHFRLASIRADIPRQLVRETVRSGRVRPIDSMAPLSEADIDEASHLVGQMGTEAFCRALRAEADVVIAGRACDTAIFAAVPALLGCPMGPAMHMAKIIECASLCCVPGGRDPILATLEGDSFGLVPAHEPAHHPGHLGQDVANAGDEPLVAGAAQQDRALADPDRAFQLDRGAGGGDPLRAGNPGAPVVDLFIARRPTSSTPSGSTTRSGSLCS